MSNLSSVDIIRIAPFDNNVTGTCHVFVYGTLKQGLYNFETYLKPAIKVDKASFIGAARTSHADFHMMLNDKGFFPCMFRVAADGYRVSGEVFYVDDDILAALDLLEKVDEDLYQREQVEVELLDGERQGEMVPAAVYLTPDADDLLKLERIANYEADMNAKFAVVPQATTSTCLKYLDLQCTQI